MPSSRLPDLSRARIESATVSFFRRGWRTLPDIRLVELDGFHMVVKDWARRGRIRRLLQGRFMLGREYWFLNRLQGVSGVPRVYGFVDDDALSIEFFADARPVSEVHPHEYERGYWDRLDTLVRACHARGVAHGDLDQEDNIFVMPDGTPAIIDFGGAVSNWRGSVLHRAAFDFLACHDLWCVERLRMKKDLFPDERQAPSPPPLKSWQRRLLIFFNKMERREPGRTHGVGEAPQGAQSIPR